MLEIINQLKVVQATTFSFYLKAHNYHWNVTGPNFAQYHEYLGDLYAEVFASVDEWAENIRKHQAYAPGSLNRFLELSRISDELNIPEPEMMFKRLADDNQILLAEMYRLANMAEKANARGLVNFIEGRIDVHEKHQWMLTSFNN